MGADKSSLWFRGVPLLTRVVEAVSAVAGEVVVVAAAGQDLPPLPARVRIERDVEVYAGPLVALARGIRAAPRAGHFFVVGTDHAALAPSVVARIVATLGDHDAAIPLSGGEPALLCAAYAGRIAPVIDGLIAQGARSLRALARAIDARTLTEADLLADEAVRREDPELLSLSDADTPEALEALERRYSSSAS